MFDAGLQQSLDFGFPDHGNWIITEKRISRFLGSQWRFRCAHHPKPAGSPANQIRGFGGCLFRRTVWRRNGKRMSPARRATRPPPITSSEYIIRGSGGAVAITSLLVTGLMSKAWSAADCFSSRFAGRIPTRRKPIADRPADLFSSAGPHPPPPVWREVHRRRSIRFQVIWRLPSRLF